MAGLKFPSYYFIAAAFIAILNFYYIYSLIVKNRELKRDVKSYRNSLAASEQRNSILAGVSQKKLEAKELRIKELDKQVMIKHSSLGTLTSKLAQLRKDLEVKSRDIKGLRKVSAGYKKEISNLKSNVLKSKETLKILSGKTLRLLSNHTKLNKEKQMLSKQNENLQSEIGQHRAERGSLGQRMNTLIREKELLERQVANLTEINKAIQENIKERIKQSYARMRRATEANKKQEEDPVASEAMPQVPESRTGVRVSEMDEEVAQRGADVVKDQSDVPERTFGDSVENQGMIEVEGRRKRLSPRHTRKT